MGIKIFKKTKENNEETHKQWLRKWSKIFKKML